MVIALSLQPGDTLPSGDAPDDIVFTITRALFPPMGEIQRYEATAADRSLLVFARAARRAERRRMSEEPAALFLFYERLKRLREMKMPGMPPVQFGKYDADRGLFWLVASPPAGGVPVSVYLEQQRKEPRGERDAIRDLRALGAFAYMARLLKHARDVGSFGHHALSPEHVFVDPSSGEVISVTGIGLWEMLGADPTPARIIEAAYRAPEQFRGIHDVRADIYAAGMILYELLGGSPLDDRSTSPRMLGKPADPEAFSHALEQVSYRRLSDAVGVSPILDRFVEALTRRTAATRPSDWNVVLTELRRVTEDFITSEMLADRLDPTAIPMRLLVALMASPTRVADAVEEISKSSGPPDDGSDEQPPAGAEAPSAPPETTPSAFPETTPSAPPETTPSAPPETTTTPEATTIPHVVACVSAAIESAEEPRPPAPQVPPEPEAPSTRAAHSESTIGVSASLKTRARPTRRFQTAPKPRKQLALLLTAVFVGAGLSLGSSLLVVMYRGGAPWLPQAPVDVACPPAPPPTTVLLPFAPCPPVEPDSRHEKEASPAPGRAERGAAKEPRAASAPTSAPSASPIHTPTRVERASRSSLLKVLPDLRE